MENLSFRIIISFLYQNTDKLETKRDIEANRSFLMNKNLKLSYQIIKANFLSKIFDLKISKSCFYLDHFLSFYQKFNLLITWVYTMTSPIVIGSSTRNTPSDELDVSIGSNNQSAIVSCRMYENKYPEVDELVMVNVKQIAEMGAYVSLLEYNNIEGMILLSELSKRRIRSIQKLLRVGRNEVVVVLRVDREKGYIDLSKKKVSPEEIQKCEEKYNKSKTVHSILRHVAERKGISLEQLYENFGWPLYRKYGHAYEAFKQALVDANILFGEEIEHQLSEDLKQELIGHIVRRMTPQKVKIRSDIEVVCDAYEGIEAIKKALQAGETFCSEILDQPVRIRLVAPPLYVLVVQSSDRQQAIEAIERGLVKIEEVIRRYGGEMLVKMRPKVVSEHDDQELDALMKKSEQENAEISGDEDSSDID